MIAASAAAVGMLITTEVRAEPSPAADAKALYREGARHYDVGEYDQAVDYFQRAYLITGAPMLLLNIGQAHRLSGACALAAAAYRRYLERAGASEHRDEVERRIVEMDECAGVRTTPRAPSNESLPARPAAENPSAAPSDDLRAEAPSTSSSWRTLGWVGLGAGVTGAALGAVGLGLTLDAQAGLDRVCASDGACPRTAGSRLDAYERWRVVAISGAAVTIVGAAAAIVGFMATPSNQKSASTRSAHERSSDVAIEPWLDLSAAGLRGTF
ncbi:MAG: hypothetical protein BGO98_33430 [Myxococcales bacterium 68-20]|nr:tetratricopeptide repeat protein [Myxococcales bacterium]OJY22936.1 MAG: hypothetical protein BGO98_33430 [Myxococcales bacterium 68-20]